MIAKFREGEKESTPSPPNYPPWGDFHCQHPLTFAWIHVNNVQAPARCFSKSVVSLWQMKKRVRRSSSSKKNKLFIISRFIYQVYLLDGVSSCRRGNCQCHKHCNALHLHCRPLCKSSETLTEITTKRYFFIEKTDSVFTFVGKSYTKDEMYHFKDTMSLYCQILMR